MRKLALLPFLALALSCDNSAPLAPDSQVGPTFDAASAAVKVDIYNEYYSCGIVDPGTTKYAGKDDQIYHNRDSIYQSCFSTGDFSGYLDIGPGNAMINFVTGKGTYRGKSTYYVTWNGLSGTFVGTASGTYEGYVGGFGAPDPSVSGKFRGEGTGDFEGMKYHNTWTTDFSTFTGSETGYILMPHGLPNGS